MKHLIGVVLMLVCMAVPASAQTRFGVGWDDGYSLRMDDPQYSLQLTGRFDSGIPENDDADTETDVELTLYGACPFLWTDRSKLGVFGGFSLMPTTREITLDALTYDKNLDFAFRAGLEPRAMLTDHIGLGGKLGLQVMVDQGYDGLDDSGETEVGAWGSVGVHWFF